jgi:biopolymer transport protein ExbB/TolQ
VSQTLIAALEGPGALFMYAIALTLALGLAVGIERVWLLWFRWRLTGDALLSKLAAGDTAGAQAMAQGQPLAPIMDAGLAAGSADEAWDAMGSAAVLAERKVQDRIPYLMMVGNVATMLGLLGTVYGLIMAFSGLDDPSAVARSARLSEGIATAMATTAWGLMVGIPAIAVHAMVDRRARNTLALYEAVAGRIAAGKR